MSLSYLLFLLGSLGMGGFEFDWMTSDLAAMLLAIEFVRPSSYAMLPSEGDI